ncbi:MAG: hypothetical protein BMS9Abin33_1249 [Gammaproteobacteria bacterium]|nr:MAG: hypothetical protein BMS9Abin33_1249 [Gammaproteobacteria bacterium]
MRVLVGCEISGTVRDTFLAKGHDAYSCDLKPNEHKKHLQLDVFFAIKSARQFGDGSPWDLIILHPSCTALAVSGNRWYGKGMPRHDERIAAIRWTNSLWNTAKRYAPRVCLENPVSVLGGSPMGKPTQYIQPWQFGHGETKKTGLWLSGLPQLKPTDIVTGRDQRIWKMGPSPERAALRSITYQGIADAMAAQWG